MSNLSIHLRVEPQRVLAFGSIGSGYTGVGSPYNHPPRLYLLQNYTDQMLQFSWNGVDDHFPLGSGGSTIVDVTSNKTSTGGALMISQYDRTYVKTIGDAPTEGAVYLTIFYGSDF